MKNKCKNCYVTIKKYTFLKGLLLTISLEIVLCIPIINLWVIHIESNGKILIEKHIASLDHKKPKVIEG